MYFIALARRNPTPAKATHSPFLKVLIVSQVFLELLHRPASEFGLYTLYSCLPRMTTLEIPQAQMGQKSRPFPWELYPLIQARTPLGLIPPQGPIHMFHLPAGTRTQAAPVANTARHVLQHMLSFLIDRSVTDA